MDSNVALRLNELGFDVQRAFPISWEEVGEFVSSLRLRSKYFHGLVFFDGLTHVVATINSESVDIFSRDLAIARNARERLLIFSPSLQLANANQLIEIPTVFDFDAFASDTCNYFLHVGHQEDAVDCPPLALSIAFIRGQDTQVCYLPPIM